MTVVKQSLDTALRWLCVVLLAVLVLVVAWQVFARQVLSAPSTWSEQLAQAVFAWLGFFGAALVFGERGHIAVDVLVRRLPERWQRWNAAFCQVVILAFSAAVLVYGGWQLAALSWNQAVTGLPVNAGWLYVALPASGVLVLFYSVHHLVAVVRGNEGAAADGPPEAV